MAEIRLRKEIFKFLELLKKQFPNVKGLEDPLILKNTINISNSKTYIRVIQSQANHWICISAGNVLDNEISDEICVYDSMKRNTIEPYIGELVLKMYTTKIF